MSNSNINWGKADTVPLSCVVLKGPVSYATHADGVLVATRRIESTGVQEQIVFDHNLGFLGETKNADLILQVLDTRKDASYQLSTYQPDGTPIQEGGRRWVHWGLREVGASSTPSGIPA